MCLHGRYKDSSYEIGCVVSPDEVGYQLSRKPSRITFDECILGWNYAIKKFIEEGSWNATKTKQYLKLFCCNDSLQKRFITDALEYKNIRDSLKHDATDHFEREDLELYRNMYREGKFRLPTPPSAWSLFNIVDITETPMHLMMGCVKAILNSMLKFTSCLDRKQEFIRRCNDILQNIRELRVELVPVVKFKDEKFGGFVAENYSAMAMVIPWISHILEEQMMLPSKTCDVPDALIKPIEQWNGKECKAWLVKHGHKGCSSMKAAEAKSKVKEYFDGENENFPEEVQNPGRDLAVDVVRCLLSYANALFCTIMLSDVDGKMATNRAQALVGLFLSKYDAVDRVLMPNRTDPIWIAKYGMMGLLRVPEHFLRHRHFRNQYEGGTIGEGIVKYLRSLCPNAVRDGWSWNLLKRFYRNQSIQALCIEAKKEWMSFENFQMPVVVQSYLTEYDQKKFRRYRKLEDVIVDFEKGYLISVVVYKRNNTTPFRIAFVLQTNNCQWSLHFLKFGQGEAYIDKQGLSYFPIEINKMGIQLTCQSSLFLSGHVFDSYAVMLPNLWTGKCAKGLYRYAVLNEDWERLSCEGGWTSHRNG